MKTHRFRSWLPKDLIVTVISLGGGAVIVKIVEGSIEHGLSSAHALYFLIVLLIAFATTALVSLRDEIANEIKRSRIVVQFNFKVKKSESDAEIYEPLLRKIARARHSILVINAAVDQLDEHPSNARKEYYKKLNKILKARMEENKPFHYERILQVKGPIPNVLHSSQIDGPTFEHCDFVLRHLTQEPGATRFTLRQVERVTATCSFMIIDNLEVVLFLPWIEHVRGHFETQHIGKAIFLRDHEGSLVREMKDMYDAVALFANAIEELEPKIDAANVPPLAPNPGT
jgi:hypothetical protein